ncbi:hypothetical protein SNEBB_000731 [Seison nebaliae]|nr:hypothetical protein SNEBB_000731 [Seison nebaliae]
MFGKFWCFLLIILISSIPFSRCNSMNDDIINDMDNQNEKNDNDGEVQDEMEETDHETEPIPDDSPPTEDVPETDEATGMKANADVTTSLHYTNTEHSNFVAGESVEMLIGFHNNGSSTFLLKNIDASFHYPTQYSFLLYNFTSFQTNVIIPPGQESTIAYTIITNHDDVGRQYTFTILLGYETIETDEDVDSGVTKYYRNVLFNQTINIVDIDAHMDKEAFFMYVLIVTFTILIALVAQQMLNKFGYCRNLFGGSKSFIAKNENVDDYVSQWNTLKVKPKRKKPINNNNNNNNGYDMCDKTN